MAFWYLVVSLPFIPAYLIFLICLVVYKKIIYTILKLRYGNDLTPVANSDSLYTFGKFQDHFSFILTIMHTGMKEEYLKEKIVKEIDVTIMKNVENFKKFHSSLHSYMGYPYFIKEEIEATDFISIVDVEKNHYKSINHLAYDYSCKLLPKQNRLLLEIIILKCGTEWKVKNNLKIDQIPVLTRIHHVLGDGLSIMNLIVQVFGDHTLVIDKVIDEFNSRNKRSTFWIRLLENIYLFSIFPGFIVCNEMRLLTNNKFSLSIIGNGKQHFAYKVGDAMLIQRIKEFKRKIGNCSFSEILFTAISASLYNYFKRKDGKIPLSIGAIVPAVQRLENLNKNGLPILTNQYGYASFEIPIEIGSKSLLRRMCTVRKYTRESDTFINFLLLRFLLCNLLGIFPKCIKKIIFNTKYTNLCISNMPGTQKLDCFNGVEVSDVYFFVINTKQTGIGFSIITYDNRIHLGLKVYENIISSQEDCQLIVDDVFKYLNELIID